MNQADYQSFYDKIGAINGWDFSSIRCVNEGVAWDFYKRWPDIARNPICCLI